MIVEDEFIIAEVMMDALADIGLTQSFHASSVADAMAAARDESLAGALLDIRLNGEMVFPVAEILHARGVPFAFCSGDGDAPVIPAAYSAAPVLSKPWPEGALEALAAQLFQAAA